jgi:hypothetical protein
MNWGVQLFGELYDVQRLEWAFFAADAATDTQFFGNFSMAVYTDLNGLIAGTYPRAVNYTFLSAFLGVTPIFVNDGHSHDITRLEVKCSG